MTRVARARLSARTEGERGTSLAELLVAMMIFSVIVAVLATLTVTFTRTNSQVMTRQDQVDTARVATEVMSKKLRTSVMPSQLTTTCTACTQDAFVLGQDFAVQFYANVNNSGNLVGPSRVTYTVTSTSAGVGTLVEKVQVPDSNVPTSSGYVYCNAEATGASGVCKARLKTRILARGVQMKPGAALFSYYTYTGAPLLPSASAGSLTTTTLAQVFSVELNVAVQAASGNKVKPTTYIQRVTLPNAQAVLRQNQEANS
ncbi:MAG: hypothetical protein AAGC49_01840 [Brevundimonas sp.]